MTSWSVVFSISLIRLTENLARLLICSRASVGMVPFSACTSQTAISTSSHFWNLVSSDHSAPISGNVYLGIIVSSLRFQVSSGDRLETSSGDRLETWNLKLETYLSAVELTKYFASCHVPPRSTRVNVSIASPRSNEVW